MGELDYCMVCGICSSGCPVAGYNNMDPRKAIRLVLLGQEEDLIHSDWIYQCTGCDRCTYACPQGVKIGNLITRARSMRDRDNVPGKSQETCNLHRDKGNNMQIVTEEWIETVDWMREELEMEIPQLTFPPYDKEGAEYFATINSKLPMYHPDELQDIFTVFWAADADWTMPTRWWEGTNYCMFSGDLNSWEEVLRQQVRRDRKSVV